MKGRKGISLLLLLFVIITWGSYAQSLVLNEVVYSNKSIIQDADGDTPDWIEIYNTSGETINLKDWQLTDETDDEEYWKFPSISIQPHSYLLVFASNKNRTTGGELHTSFRLSLMKDSLFLLNPAGEIVDEVHTTCIPADLSYGYATDGSGEKVVLFPSPGKSNNNSEVIEINYQPDTLFIDRSSGFYNSAVPINLYNSVPANTIRYTLDGDIPDEESAEFMGEPLQMEDLTPYENRIANIPDTYKEPGNHIFKASIIRAVVYSAGCPASEVVSNTYFIGKKLKSRYKVPVVSIITENDNLFDDETGIYTYGNYGNYNKRGKAWERLSHIEMFDSTGKQIIDQDAGMRLSGRGSRGAPQKPLRLYARDEYGKEYFEYPFFEQKPHLNKFKTVVLRSTRGLSGTIFKDELTQNLVQNMNIDYTAARPAIVFINGEYWGIYSLRERLDEGYIANNYNLDEEPEIDVISHAMVGIELEKGTVDDYDNMVDFFRSANPEDDEFYDEVSGMIDIPQMIDYHVAEMYFGNYDFPHNNVKMWKISNSDTALWRYFFFDCDACMINVKQNILSEWNNEDIELLQVHPEWSVIIMQKMLQNKKFRDQLFMKYYYHLQNTFSPANVMNEIERLEKMYDPLVAEHTYRWYQPENYIKWQKNVEMLRVYALQRPAYSISNIEANFSNPFVMYPNPSGGSFSVVSQVEELDGDYTVVVNSLAGRVLFEETFTGNNNLVNTLLQPGMYIVQVKYQGFIFSEKLSVF